ncbi:MAG TPA: hypothetical protein VG204_14390 [Terriglobia bacterium]|nr:hypothetical protein [Terriglobia bacterium]
MARKRHGDAPLPADYLERPPSVPIHRSTKAWLACAALLLAGLAAGWHLATWPARLRYPGEESRIEGIQLAEMVHLARGAPIYAAPSHGRFDTANYGPLYYLLGSWLADPARPAAIPMRWVAVLSALGCAIGSSLLAYWLAESMLAATLAPLLFLANGFVTRYATTIRCDFPALFLIFAGFLVAYRFRHGRWLLASIPVLLAGLFFKQQFAAAPLAILLYLILEKRRRLAMEFAALLGAGGIALLAVFQFVVFRGQAFLAHVTIYNLLPPDGHRFVVEGEFFAIVVIVPLLLGIECLRRHPSRLLACYLGLAVLLSLLTVGRVGADTNYFLEDVLILSALVAALFAKTLAEPPRAREVLVLITITFFIGLFTSSPAPDSTDLARDRAIQSYLRENFSAGTPALTYYAGDLTRAGLDVPASNLFHYVWLIRKGTLPGADLLANISERRYGVIVLNFDPERDKNPNQRELYLTPRMLEAIAANYRPATSLAMPEPEQIHDDDRFYVWVPRPK